MVKHVEYRDFPVNPDLSGCRGCATLQRTTRKRATDQRDTALSSETGTVQSNPNGSIDVYFGPKRTSEGSGFPLLMVPVAGCHPKSVRALFPLQCDGRVQGRIPLHRRRPSQHDQSAGPLERVLILLFQLGRQ